MTSDLDPVIVEIRRRAAEYQTNGPPVRAPCNWEACIYGGEIREIAEPEMDRKLHVRFCSSEQEDMPVCACAKCGGVAAMSVSQH